MLNANHLPSVFFRDIRQAPKLLDKIILMGALGRNRVVDLLGNMDGESGTEGGSGVPHVGVDIDTKRP
jgi:hypothetical protein